MKQRLCPVCDKPVGEESRSGFCSEACRLKWEKWVRLQKMIDRGSAPRGFCSNREQCDKCPFGECTALTFAFVIPYKY